LLSPFTLEVTSDKFNFNNKTVVINEGTPLDYEVKETPSGANLSTLKTIQ
jgi:hypothetical protein